MFMRPLTPLHLGLSLLFKGGRSLPLLVPNLMAEDGEVVLLGPWPDAYASWVEVPEVAYDRYDWEGLAGCLVAFPYLTGSTPGLVRVRPVEAF